MLEQLLTWSIIIGIVFGGLVVGESIRLLIKKTNKKWKQ